MRSLFDLKGERFAAGWFGHRYRFAGRVSGKENKEASGPGWGEQLRHTQTQTRRGQGKDTVSLRGQRRKRQNKGRGVAVNANVKLWNKHLVIIFPGSFLAVVTTAASFRVQGKLKCQRCQYYVRIFWCNVSLWKTKNKPGTSNGMFPNSNGFISHIRPVRSQ